ncbi:MAG: hypothetical protein QM737_18230 [Ferruginibacter sp.]
MKKIITFCSLVLAALSVHAQSADNIDFSKNPLPPTLVLSSVLENGFDMEPLDKCPHFGLAKIVFLPLKYTDGSDVMYEGKHIIKFEIEQAGKIFTTRFIDPFAMHEVTSSLKHDDLDFQEDMAEGLAAGTYNYTVSIGMKKIFTMPFQIILIKNDDVYANKKEMRLVDGYWSKFGFYTFNSEGNMEWTYYTTDLVKKWAENPNQSKSWEDEVQLFYEGKAISKPMKHTYSSVLAKWYTQANTFEKIASSDFIQKDDLKDGHYIIKVKLNGEAREYAFEISGGKMQLIPEQDKTKTTDITKVFEGMNKEFWVKRSK